MEKEISKAFVVINVKIGSERDTFKKLEKLPNIKEAHIVYGTFDIIARIEANSMEKLKDNIADIRNMDSVRSTLTMIVVNS